MSEHHHDTDQRCPECGAAAGCDCPAEGFGLRVRPYVTLPEPAEPEPPRASVPYTPAPLPAQRDVPPPGRPEPAPDER
ncbi:hypothetical protein GTW43_14160, partial [Streptomyces sp. SID5785]|nr:hypothetical protein [Streptomyces sp. SID5785]